MFGKGGQACWAVLLELQSNEAPPGQRTMEPALPLAQPSASGSVGLVRRVRRVGPAWLGHLPRACECAGSKPTCLTDSGLPDPALVAGSCSS